jgi:hypothetical protein
MIVAGRIRIAIETGTEAHGGAVVIGIAIMSVGASGTGSATS